MLLDSQNLSILRDDTILKFYSLLVALITEESLFSVDKNF